MGSEVRSRLRSRLLKVALVLALCFTAGLTSAGVVSGAGPLSVLSLASETDPPESTDTSSTQSESTETTQTETEPTDTEPTEPDPTEPEPTEPEPTDTGETETQPSPTGLATIRTNSDDYAPGALVLVVGSGWVADEEVELFANDHEGQSWSHRDTVVADSAGDFYYEFRLPEWFVATYSLSATGQVSGTVDWTFTDSIATGANSTASNGDPGASEITIATPTTSAGALLIAQIAVEGLGTSQVICTPTGWTTQTTSPSYRTNNSSSVAQQVFYRAADGTEAASYTWKFRTTSGGCAGSSGAVSGKGAVGGIISYTGVDVAHASGPIFAIAGATGSSPTQNAPSIGTVPSPVPAGSKVIRYFSNDKEFAISTAASSSNGIATSQVYAVNRPKSGGGFLKPSGAAADAEQPAAQVSTGTLQASNSGNGGNWVAQTVVLRMAVLPVTSAPTVSAPICAGATNVSGTSGEANGTVIEVFKNGVSVGSTTMTTAPNWTKSGLAALVAGDQIKAKATAPGETVSGDSNVVTVASCNAAPAAATNLAQFRSNGTTAIALGGFTNESTVILKGDLSDPDTNDSVKLEVEVKPVGTAFDGSGTVLGSAVTDPATASATVSSLADGGYHWRGRAVDDDGAAGPWTSFGGNPETTAADFTVDTVGPTLTASATSPPGGPAYVAGAWTNQAVRVAFACQDTGSGVGTDTVPDVTLTSDGENQSVTSTGICADNAGNQAAAATFSNIDIDQTAPLVSCGSADGNWHANDVSIACTASDGTSGLASSGDASFSLSTSVPAGTETDNAATDSRVVSDNAGNSATAGPITGNKVDKKDPAVTCTPPDNSVWYGSNVTVTCTATDGGSGLADAGDASFSLTTSVSDGTHDASASTGQRTVEDAVGNEDTVGPFTFKVDRADPSLTCSPPDTSVWYGSNVTVNCTATDNGGSGLANPADASFSLSTNVAAGVEDASASTPSETVEDAVGNSATVGPFTFKVDRKAPAVTCGSADGAWHANDVSIACTATDGGSGLANAADASFSLVTNVPAGTETANASTNTHTVADAVGNSTVAGPVTGNKVDKKGPTVTLSCAPTVVLGSSASASWTAADGGSGVKPGYGSGSVALDTSSVGPKTATVPAGASQDNVDNPSPAASCSYSVVFNFLGFFQPVDNAPVVNVVNAGRAIPVKFSLGGDQGLNIFAPGYPKSTLVPCDGSAGTDVLEETSTAGSSSLQYDPTVNPPVGQYIYVWKTEKTWASTCRRLDVKFVDGVTKSAFFSFRK